MSVTARGISSAMPMGGKSRQRVPLTYGSSLALSPADFGDQSGYITSSGPADPRLYIRTSNTVQEQLGFESNVFTILTPVQVRQRLHAEKEQQKKFLAVTGATTIGNEFGLDQEQEASSETIVAARRQVAATSTSGSDAAGGEASYAAAAALMRNNNTHTSADDVSTLGQPVAYGSKFCLMHKQSGMLVALLSTQPSAIDSNCFVISLVPSFETSSSAHFKLAPRYKIHSDGDTVYSGDQVVMQLFNRPVFMHLSTYYSGSERAGSLMGDGPHHGGMGLHPSGSGIGQFGSTIKGGNLAVPAHMHLGATNNSFGGSELLTRSGSFMLAGQQKLNEVNGSEQSTSWVITRYDAASDDHTYLKSTIKAGKVGVLTGTPLAFFHREMEMVVTTTDLSLKEDQNTYMGMVGKDDGANASPVNVVGREMFGTGDMLKPPQRVMGQRSPSRVSDAMNGVAGMPPTPRTPNLATTLSTSNFHSAVVLGEAGLSSEDFNFSTLQCRCAALWVLEGADPTAGGPIRTRLRYRIRQAATNRYLSVGASSNAPEFGSDDRSQPMLQLVAAPKTEEELSRSLFAVSLVVDNELQGGFVTQSDFLKIQHIDTGTWLGTVQTDDDVLVTLLPRWQPHDALLAGHVIGHLQRSVLHLYRFAETLEKCRDYFAKTRTQDLKGREVQQVLRSATDALVALISFCSDSENDNALEREGLPIYYHQQMLFDLYIHRLLIEATVAPFIGKVDHLPNLNLQGGAFDLRTVRSADGEPLFDLLRLCMRLLKQMIKGAPDLAVRISDYIPLMYVFDGLKLHVADTVIEFFGNNLLLPFDLKIASIDHYTNILLERRSGGYLRILSALATDSLYRSIVCEQLVVKNPAILSKLDMNDNVLNVVLEKSTVDLTRFLLQSSDQKQVKFFEAQIELYSQLSQGSTPFVVDTLRPLLPQEQCAWILRNVLWGKDDSVLSLNKLDITRAYFIDIALNLHVLPSLRTPFVQLRAGVPLLASSKLRHSCPTHSGVTDSQLIETLKYVCKRVIRDNPFQIMENRRRNLLLKSCVTAWKRLIEHWQYTEEDLIDVLPMLTGVLYGAMDTKTLKKAVMRDEGSAPADSAKTKVSDWNRHRLTEDGIVAFQVKEAAIETLHLLLDNMAHVKSNQILVRSSVAMLNGTSEGSEERITMIEEAAMDIIERFQTDRLIPFLLDITRYEMQSLARKALDLIAHLGFVRQMIFEKVTSLPLTRDRAVATFFDDCFSVAESLVSQVNQLSAEAANAVAGSNVVEKTSPNDYYTGRKRAISEGPDMGPATPRGRSFDVSGYGITGATTRPRRDSEIYMSGDSKTLLRSTVMRVMDLMDRGCGADHSQLVAATIISHWGIHLTLLRLLEKMALTDPSYPLIVRFFQRFTQVEENARRLSKRTDVFLAGIQHPSAHNDCLRIIVAIMTSSVSSRAEMDMSLVAKIEEMILVEKNKDRDGDLPDCSLLQMINKSCASESLPFRFLRELVEGLHQRNVFSLLREARSSWHIAKLQFTADLLVLLNHYASNSAQARNAVNKIITPGTIIKVLLQRTHVSSTQQPGGDSSSAANPSAGGGGAPERLLPLILQGPYFKLLASLWTFEDESSYEMQRIRTQWTNSGDWWMLLGTIRDQIQRMTHNTAYSTSDPHYGMEKFMTQYVVPAVAMFYGNCMQVALASRKQELGLVTRELCAALRDAIKQRPTTFGTASVYECAGVLADVCEQMDMKVVALYLSEARQLITQERKNAESAKAILEANGALPPHQTTQRGLSSDDDVETSEQPANTAKPNLPENLEKCCVSQEPIISLVRLMQSSLQAPTAAHDDFLVKTMALLKRGDLSMVTSVSLVKIFSQVLSDCAEAEMVVYQDNLDQLGLMRVATALSESKDDSVLVASYQLGIALLEGGNTRVQNRMLDYFETHDEKFFQNVKATIERCKQAVLAFRKKGPTNSSKKVAQVDAILDLTRLAFRFLQLLCEGHHIGMQNYVRDQQDNLHSINMVYEVTLLMKEMCLATETGRTIGSGDESEEDDNEVDRDDRFKTLSLIKLLPALNGGFALLTEVCQGPCPANQAALLAHGICSMIVHGFTVQPSDETLMATEDGKASDISSEDSDGDDGDEDNLSPSELLDQLRSRASTTLLAILEGCTDARTYNLVANQVPLQTIRDLLEDMMSERSQNDIVNQLENDDISETVFNLLIFLIQVWPFGSAEYGGMIHELMGQYQHLSKYLGSVEIQREERLENVFFRVPRLCMSLTAQAKDLLLWSVDRSNRSTKLADFVQQADEIIFEMDVTHKFENNVAMFTRFSLKGTDGSSHLQEGPVMAFCSKVLKRLPNPIGTRIMDEWNKIAPYVFTHKLEYYEKLFLAMAIIVNMSLLTFGRKLSTEEYTDDAIGDGFVHSNHTSAEVTSHSNDDATAAESVPVVELPTAFLSNETSNLTFAVGANLTPSDESSPNATNQSFLVWLLLAFIRRLFNPFGISEDDTMGIPPFLFSIVSLSQLFLTVGVLTVDSYVLLPSYLYRTEKRRQRRKDAIAKPQALTLMGRITASKAWQVATRLQTVYRSLLVLFSLLSLTVSPLFSAAYLIALVHQSSVLMNVIVAITQNGRSLLLTMGLGVVMVYLFAIVGFIYFPSSFGEREEGGEPNCDSFGRCFAYILVHGLRQGGGVGDIMKDMPWSSTGLIPRMGYDFLFFALLNVVFLNILFGIIIDAFAELRDDKRTKEEDMHGTCYICGTQAEEFEKHGVSFLWHVRKEHNMWQYLYLMYHLRNKDPNEYTGQESYVQKLLDKGSLGFFPEETSLALQAKLLHLQPIPGANDDNGNNGTTAAASGQGTGASKADAEKDVNLITQLIATLQESSSSFSPVGLAELRHELVAIRTASRTADGHSNNNGVTRSSSLEEMTEAGGNINNSSTKLGGGGDAVAGGSNSNNKVSATTMTLLTSELAASHRLCEKLHIGLAEATAQCRRLEKQVSKHEATIAALTDFFQKDIPVVWHDALREIIEAREGRKLTDVGPVEFIEEKRRERAEEKQRRRESKAAKGHSFMTSEPYSGITEVEVSKHGSKHLRDETVLQFNAAGEAIQPREKKERSGHRRSPGRKRDLSPSQRRAFDESTIPRIDVSGPDQNSPQAPPIRRTSLSKQALSSLAAAKPAPPLEDEHLSSSSSHRSNISFIDFGEQHHGEGKRSRHRSHSHSRAKDPSALLSVSKH